MIKLKPWHRLPSEPVTNALPLLRWTSTGVATPAGETAAAMLYIALNFMAETGVNAHGRFASVAAASYVDLAHATGLSRSLISAGLQRLVQLELITPEGSHQKRRYLITWPEEYRFFKLPCKAIVTGGEIRPFRHFTLRSKHELHALKLYLYFASIRSNVLHFSMASYETIFERTRISERDVRKAISLMISSGLMISVDRDHKQMLSKNEPNKYFLAGYHVLVQDKGKSEQPSPPAESVARATMGQPF
jgi:hypothetical protein